MERTMARIEVLKVILDLELPDSGSCLQVADQLSAQVRPSPQTRVADPG